MAKKRTAHRRVAPTKRGKQRTSGEKRARQFRKTCERLHVGLTADGRLQELPDPKSRPCVFCGAKLVERITRVPSGYYCMGCGLHYAVLPAPGITPIINELKRLYGELAEVKRNFEHPPPLPTLSGHLARTASTRVGAVFL